jgi:hypothetical protein
MTNKFTIKTDNTNLRTEFTQILQDHYAGKSVSLKVIEVSALRDIGPDQYEFDVQTI